MNGVISIHFNMNESNCIVLIYILLTWYVWTFKCQHRYLSPVNLIALYNFRRVIHADVPLQDAPHDVLVPDLCLPRPLVLVRGLLPLPPHPLQQVHKGLDGGHDVEGRGQS